MRLRGGGEGVEDAAQGLVAVLGIRQDDDGDDHQLDSIEQPEDFRQGAVADVGPAEGRGDARCQTIASGCANHEYALRTASDFSAAFDVVEDLADQVAIYDVRDDPWLPAAARAEADVDLEQAHKWCVTPRCTVASGAVG